ncbi:MAG: LacI family DNA-binding transcriptional regulator [Phycisphaerales bacterium JB040]
MPDLHTPSQGDKPPVATLSALAKELGLSATTVSFVLNGQAEKRRISAQTVERVRQAAAKFDYIPNALARGLRQQRTGAIGVVFPHLRDDWAHRVMRGIADSLRGTDTVPLMVCHHGSGDLEMKLLRSLVERRVDGIVCNPLADGFNRYRQVRARGVPLVFLSDIPKGLEEISFTAWDPAAVAVAVRHLIALGHTRVAFLGVRDNRRISAARRHVFRDTLEDAGLELSRHHVVLNEPGEPFDGPVRDLLSRDDAPTAIFALYDDIAVAAIETAQRMGLRCPEDISVATIGGAPRHAGPSHTQITTVLCPVEDEGRACCETLMQVIEQPDAPPIGRYVQGAEFHAGQSTAPPPG